jgi:hypothetical protein
MISFSDEKIKFKYMSVLHNRSACIELKNYWWLSVSPQSTVSFTGIFIENLLNLEMISQKN